MLLVADARDVATRSLGVLRLKLADELGIERSGFDALWIIDFPMFEYDAEEDALRREPPSVHHARRGARERIERRRSRCCSLSYDLVINGVEIGGGTIRIHNADLQMRVFEHLGHPEEEAREHFGFLLEALVRRPAARRDRARARPAHHAARGRALDPRRHRVPEDRLGRRPADRRARLP